MPTVSDIFNRLGGPARVGTVIGKPTEHAAGMRRRGSIPVSYWPNLISATPMPGCPPVTYPDLVAAHARDAAMPAQPAQPAQVQS